MKTKRRTNSLPGLWRRIFRKRAPLHDPFLSLSMDLFNRTDKWSRGFQGLIMRSSRLTSDY
jgi:hypothetical protein